MERGIQILTYIFVVLGIRENLVLLELNNLFNMTKDSASFSNFKI